MVDTGLEVKGMRYVENISNCWKIAITATIIPINIAKSIIFPQSFFFIVKKIKTAKKIYREKFTKPPERVGSPHKLYFGSMEKTVDKR